MKELDDAIKNLTDKIADPKFCQANTQAAQLKYRKALDSLLDAREALLWIG